MQCISRLNIIEWFKEIDKKKVSGNYVQCIEAFTPGLQKIYLFASFIL